MRILECPEELERAVTDFSGQLIDWKEEHDKLQATKDQQIAELTSERDLLKQQIDKAEPKLGVRVRETLLKIIYGMAVSYHGYNPKARRSTVISEIVSELARVGVSVTDDTVRDYLRQAADLVPPVTDETET